MEFYEQYLFLVWEQCKGLANVDLWCLHFMRLIIRAEAKLRRIILPGNYFTRDSIRLTLSSPGHLWDLGVISLNKLLNYLIEKKQQHWLDKFVGPHLRRLPKGKHIVKALSIDMIMIAWVGRWYVAILSPRLTGTQDEGPRKPVQPSEAAYALRAAFQTEGGSGTLVAS